MGRAAMLDTFPRSAVTPDEPLREIHRQIAALPERAPVRVMVVATLGEQRVPDADAGGFGEERSALA
ncbi:hypothetical protein ABTY96_47220 [Streptomyces sp. NPDC096057]|uniref:hypothetical protein n=1 Tax=Streptomyces sp. NPDC096057 TaxID=3155543 RepID=UPI0033254A64